jgi:L-ascorbate metabolism protein UlaG (beta-lactamase superfamily)
MRALVDSAHSTGILLAFAFLWVAGCTPPPEIQVHYLGHASFVLEFGDGPVVLTDFGESNAYGLDSPIYDLGDLVPDVLTTSHDHADHLGGELPEGIGKVLDREESFTSQGLTITPIPTHERSLINPDNLGFLFEYRGLKILHAGDCQGLMVALRGGALSPEGGLYSREEVGELIREVYPDSYDLVLLPIGSPEPILREAAEFAGFLDARIIVPMHFWDPADRTAFLERMGGRRDRLDRPYAVGESGAADIRLLPASGPVETVEVVGLTPSPYAAGDPAP